MAGISIGSVSVSVVPSAIGFADKVRAQILPQAALLGTDWGKAFRDSAQAQLKDLKIGVDTSAANAKIKTTGVNVDALKASLDELNKRVSAQIGVGGDKQAEYQVRILRDRLTALSRTISSPGITLEGAQRTETQILGVSLALDKLDKKSADAGGSGGGLFSLNKAIAAVGGALGGGGGGAGAAGGAGIAGIGAGGLIAIIGSLLPVVVSLTAVTLGAGAGLAAFAAVGAQSYGKLTSNISALHTANENFQQAALNVDTAIKTSAVDAGIYNKAIAAMPPNLGAAARLLGDQNVRWQDLTKSQQDNVVALANNASAVRSMLPSQRTALTALLAGKKAWDDMSPAQQRAATSLNQVSVAWGKLVAAFEPQVMSVISQGMGIALRVVAAIGPLVTAALPGIHALVGVIGNELVLALKTLGPMVGPAFKAFTPFVGALLHLFQVLLQDLASHMDVWVRLTEAITQLIIASGPLITFLINIIALGAKFYSIWIPRFLSGLHDFASAFDHTRTLIGNWWKDLEIFFLTGLSNILGAVRGFTGVMGHLPGPFGAPFRAASDAIDAERAHLKLLQQEIDNTRSKSVGIDVTGTGHWSISNVGPGGPGHRVGAAGMLVSGGTPGKDSVPILAMPGEALVPVHLVPMLAPFLAANKVPGFAQGGIVPDYKGQVQGLAPWVHGNVNATFTTVADALASAIKTGISAAVASAGAGFGRAGPGGGAPSMNAALAQLMYGNVMRPGDWPAWNYVAMRESGWNQYARNPSSGAYGIPQALPESKLPFAGQAAGGSNPAAQISWMWGYMACVPLDTEILTRRGWLTYDQLEAGDETIGYNPETGRSEWTAVTAVSTYEDAPLVRLSSKTWEATCTPNHRWSVKNRYRPRDRGYEIRSGRSGSYTADEMATAQEISYRHSLRLAAPAETGDGPVISDGEAELLGWVMGDGSVTHYRSRTPGSAHWRTGTGSMTRISLAQAKPEGITAIDELLAQEGVLFSRSVRKPQGMARLPGVRWVLRASYTAELLKRSGYDHLDPVPFVLSLSESQREAFLRGIFGADGSQGEPHMLYGRGPYPAMRLYSQADGPQQDAIVLALCLSGYRPSIQGWSTASRAALGSRAGANIGEAKPFIGGASVRRENAGCSAVWCPTTVLGTWMMRQGRQVMLTGNSVYGGPQGAAAHEQAYNWYDKGNAWLPPGGFGLNGTGRPEAVFNEQQLGLLTASASGGGTDTSRLERQMDRLISAVRNAPPATGAYLAEALSGVARGSAHWASHSARG